MEKPPKTAVSRSQTAARILKTAKMLFAEAGFENTTTSSIARLAQSSESQIIKYFGNKEGLLEAIFEEGWEHISEGFSAVEFLSTPAGKLQALAGLVLTKLEDDEQLKELFLFEGRRVRKEGHLIMMTQGFLRLVSIIDGLLQQLRDQGQLRADLHVEAIRSSLIGCLEGLLRDKLLADRSGYPASFNSGDIRKVFLNVLRSFMVQESSTTEGAAND